ncbi:hypothetical protein [Acinetobacter sp. CFCC 10889]|uniref:hypothetical protein n=1 Tax=Acinetobacter sp. CFCC 10889 TaxID=1775557 RepID=UPI001D1946BE|nr:hypothetical protein [Acinetobacter sp. CFCC 10889]
MDTLVGSKYMNNFLLRLFLSLTLTSTPALADTEYFCFDAKNNKTLLLNAHYSKKTQLMYFPYMQPIQLKFKHTDAIEMAEDRPFEFHDFFDEITHGKVTGHYEIVHQGALFYGITYTHKKTKKITEFTRFYDLDHAQIPVLTAKGIECL